MSSTLFSIGAVALLAGMHLGAAQTTDATGKTAFSAAESLAGAERGSLRTLAFPGAEGYGKYALGGRGGRVIAVTNLNDSGPGSFRSAVGEAGPRIVVFRVGGVIRLLSTCDITQPNLTIAGQTAPGDGILFTGEAINICASEVIVRNIRRRYDGATASMDGIGIIAGGTEVRNVILDRCSISWGTDENVGINGKLGGVRNVTLQYCIIAEGLTYDAGHSMGLLMNGWKSWDNGPDNVTLYRNLFANNQGRNPMVGDGIAAEMVNNVVYHWRTAATTMGNRSRMQYLGNYFRAGPSTVRPDRVIDCVYVKDFANVGLYLDGNIAATRPTDSHPQHAILSSIDVPGATAENVLSSSPILTDAMSTATSAAAAVRHVLASAGAFPRDAVDQRQVDSFLNNTGAFVRLAADVGGLPTIVGGTPPLDEDGDGMPDAWEIQNSHNPLVADDSEDADQNGYTAIEEYINSIVAQNGRTISVGSSEDAKP